MAPPVHVVVSVTPLTTDVIVTSASADVINDTVTHDANPINHLTVNFYSKICWSLIGTLGLLGNLIVIVAILANPVTRKRLTNLLVINQCFIDLIAALCLLMMALLDEQVLMTFTKDKVIHEVICRVWFSGALVWGSFMASGYGIVFLSFERYLAIVHPFQHATKFTRSRAVVGIVVIWIVGYAYNLAYFVPTTVIVDGVCLSIWYWPSVVSQRCVFVLTFLLQYTIPMCCLAVSYSRMYHVLHRRMIVGNGRNVGTKRNRCNGFRRRLGESLKAVKRSFRCYKNTACLRESQFAEMSSSVAPTVTCVSFAETEIPEIMSDLRPRPSVEAELDHRSTRSRKSIAGAGPNTPSETCHVHPSSKAVTPHANTTWPTTYDKAKRNLFKTMAAVSISFVICWSPNQLLFVLSSFGVQNLYGYVYDFTVLLVLLQCFINPFIYAVKYRDFKTSIRLLINRRKKKTPKESSSFSLTQ